MHVASELMDFLTRDLSQGERLLRLHTVLGADALVAERMEVHEGIGPSVRDAWGDVGGGSAASSSPAAYSGLRIVVDALGRDVHLELKRLLGQPARLDLLTQQSRSELRPWHGHITRAELLGSDGGVARFRLVIKPWLAFLAQGRNSWAYLDRSVVEIIEEVFARYRGRGKLVPAWRWDLADAAVYRKRSLCIQYQESDLAFVQRLLREEGLFHWIEHSAQGLAGPGQARAAANGADETEHEPDVQHRGALGSHTVVLADHNGAFRSDIQPLVRYTQSGLGLGEDSITRWRRSVHVRTAALQLASRDYRSLGIRAVSQSGIGPQAREVGTSEVLPADAGLIAGLGLSDVPGIYAYTDSAQGERLALRQMQAIDATREQTSAEGNVRSLAPGRLFTLADHPRHDGGQPERDRFVVLEVQHRARNNLPAEMHAQFARRLGFGAGEARLPNDAEEPIYSNRLLLQRAVVPVRMAPRDQQGKPDPRLHPRPNIHGVQSALVVGLGEPLHTDRDHRIKIQHHWQRGGRSSHRLGLPASMEDAGADNAPASDASGTWVRVAESIAGANWGSNFTPRLGQEVLVAFVQGNIDRPVVIGSVYNGEGQPNAEANRVAAGAAGAVGNAPGWFPGSEGRGPLQGHRHGAVLTGYKTQELVSSQNGGGGYNQLVFDKTAGAERIELATTTAATRLQLGHLLKQAGNQRLQSRGHGVDLGTSAWGAVRAGSGLLVSAHGRPGTVGSGKQLDSREPLQQLEDASRLVETLAESAQKHNAKLAGEPAVAVGDGPAGGGKSAECASTLGVVRALRATQASLRARDERGDEAESDQGTVACIGGGAGVVPAWSRPDLVLAAPAGVACFTPASTFYSAGVTLGLVGNDLQHLAQGGHATAVRDGVVLYTLGKATVAGKPNAETGIGLHAASGSVQAESKSGAARFTADKNLKLQSTTAMVRITAPNHILFTAGGGALVIEPSGITLKGPGKVEFKGAMKELTGPGTAMSRTQSNPPVALGVCQYRLDSAAREGAAFVPL